MSTELHLTGQEFFGVAETSSFQPPIAQEVVGAILEDDFDAKAEFMWRTGEQNGSYVDLHNFLYSAFGWMWSASENNLISRKAYVEFIAMVNRAAKTELRLAGDAASRWIALLGTIDAVRYSGQAETILKYIVAFAKKAGNRDAYTRRILHDANKYGLLSEAEDDDLKREIMRQPLELASFNDFVTKLESRFDLKIIAAWSENGLVTMIVDLPEWTGEERVEYAVAQCLQDAGMTPGSVYVSNMGREHEGRRFEISFAAGPDFKWSRAKKFMPEADEDAVKQELYRQASGMAGFKNFLRILDDNNGEVLKPVEAESENGSVLMFIEIVAPTDDVDAFLLVLDALSAAGTESKVTYYGSEHTSEDGWRFKIVFTSPWPDFKWRRP